MSKSTSFGGLDACTPVEALGHPWFQGLNICQQNKSLRWISKDVPFRSLALCLETNHDILCILHGQAVDHFRLRFPMLDGVLKALSLIICLDSPWICVGYLLDILVGIVWTYVEQAMGAGWIFLDS